jgi:hypothetical protein
MADNIDVHVNESASRTVHIKREDGITTGSFRMSGHGTIVQTMRLTGLTGPCTSVNTSTHDWISRPADDVVASLRVKVKDDGSYEIQFVGPEETTDTTSTGRNVNDCGAAFPTFPPDPPTELTWNKWMYVIRCPSNDGICRTFDNNSAGRGGAVLIDGTTVETIIGASDAAERRSWLNVSPVGTSRSDDGSPIPVKVKTTWTLTLDQP